MWVTWPTSHAATGWLKELAELNIDCAALAHTHGLWLLPFAAVCAQELPWPLLIPTQAAAHLHAGDLANVPCFHWLVESSR